MKKENLLKTTTNNRVYNILQKENLASKHGLCPFCSYHSGCNYWFRHKPNRNWKEYRKLQYKEIKKNEKENEI